LGKFSHILETAAIFLIMGVFSVASYLQKQDTKVNMATLTRHFYINIVSGWGFYSLVTSYNGWFGQYPQKIFTIMTVVTLGFNGLEYLKDNNVLGKLIETFLNKKK